MHQIISVKQGEYTDQIKELYWEYLQWANARLNDEYNINFDIQTILEDDMKHLDKFINPKGRLFLVSLDGQMAGIACLKELTSTIGEIKRMYVRPAFRRNGLGQALVKRLLKVAKEIGYDAIRLDSTRYMENAHRMYQKMGFREIEPYEGSEIPKEYQQYWKFMEVPLN